MRPWRVVDGGLRVDVRVSPRASRERIEGFAKRPGGIALKVAVTAPPADGRANDAVIALLAKAWRLPKSAFEIAAGAAARDKTIRIAGEGAAIARKLEDWMGALT
jgi:uncharacterized protein